jgi:glutamine synthetase
MRHCVDSLLPLMLSIRQAVDGLEALVDDAIWPLPSYQEMLFIR